MTRIAFLATVLALPMSAAAAPTAEGRIETEDGRFEILGRPWRAGDRIDLPEGFLRVEEQGTEDREVGSFGVIAGGMLAAAGSATPAAAADAGDPADATPGEQPCEEERAAYLAELWKPSGIQVADPIALLEGLQGGTTGPGTGFYWFALATDPFRPLAWSSDLRARAAALTRCIRGE